MSQTPAVLLLLATLAPLTSSAASQKEDDVKDGTLSIYFEPDAARDGVVNVQ